jgi:hypothetical protein
MKTIEVKLIKKWLKKTESTWVYLTNQDFG